MARRPTEHAVPTGPDAAPAGTGAPSPVDPGPPPPEPSHAERARTLMAGANRGSLSTLAGEPEGYPFGSVATFALDDRGNPLFLISLMAEHTQNAIRDPRASLLVAEPVPAGTDPLATGRVTLLGLLSEVAASDRPAVRDRYLESNPTSAYYVDFGDFAFYRLDVSNVRYVGGYGRMSWVKAGAYASAEPDPLRGAAAGIVEHMNVDHGEAQVLFCRHLAGRPDTTEASMSAVDRYGFDMIAVGPGGRSAVRLGFPGPCSTGDQVRQAMVAMVREARDRASRTAGSS
jgi:putative heme iron utilization protein